MMVQTGEKAMEQKMKKNRLHIVVLIAAFLAVSSWASAPAVAQEDAPVVFITGANRGIGFSFVQKYAERGWTVVATCRNPAGADELQTLASEHENVTVEELDVLDVEEIEALAAKYQDTPIDLLLNNAGINPYRVGGIANFGNMDFDRFEQILMVNVIGPVRVTEAFMENVAASEQKKIVVMTSTGGSVEHSVKMGRTSAPDYRASKSAINMIMKLLSLEVAERGIKVGIIGPNRFDDASINSMISIMDGLSLENSGVFYNAAGDVMPW
jgi:NAD(P)-dependent dehydrogenase (short-subunit alcohol dehydrogenase family)